MRSLAKTILTVAVLMPAFADAELIESRAFFGKSTFLNIGANLSPTSVAVLDTEAETVTFSPFSYTIPATTYSRQHFIKESELICNFDICDTFTTTKVFERHETMDPFTIGMSSPVTVPVTLIRDDFFEADLPVDSLDLPERITGTWSITGPTESFSEDFDLPAFLSRIATRHTMSRDPESTGSIVDFTHEFVINLGIEDRPTRMVDGESFTLSAVALDTVARVPEPSTIALCSVASLACLGAWWRRRRLFS